MRVLIVDYKMNNLGSISRALEECGAQVIVSDDFHDAAQADKIVLPGIGAFPDAMKNLHKLNWVDVLQEEVKVKKKPVLGICLGMQLLATEGQEIILTDGLGFIPGVVKKLVPVANEEKIPHIGWNEVYQKSSTLLFKDIPQGADFYFVHSFVVVPVQEEAVQAITPHGGFFAAAIQKDNIFGVQFHPEKSMPVGMRLLKNFLMYA